MHIDLIADPCFTSIEHHDATYAQLSTAVRQIGKLMHGGAAKDGTDALTHLTLGIRLSDDYAGLPKSDMNRLMQEVAEAMCSLFDDGDNTRFFSKEAMDDLRLLADYCGDTFKKVVQRMGVEEEDGDLVMDVGHYL
jgi:hypothetical protein